MIIAVVMLLILISILYAAIYYAIVAFFNPKIEVKLTPAAPKLGEIIKLDWTISARREAIVSLTFTLECVEQTRSISSRGKTTNTTVLLSKPLATITQDHSINIGTFSVQLPKDLPPSLGEYRHKIVWILKVHGDIPRWLDMQDEFVFTVLPKSKRSTRSSEWSKRIV